GGKLVNGGKTLVPSKNRQAHIRNKIESFPLLDACDYTFEAEYSKNKLTGTLKINDAKVSHEIVVSITDEISLGYGLIQLYIFDRDKDSLQHTFVKAGVISKEDKKSLKLLDARRHIDDLSGIAIYRNDFRIRPYGDKDTDWLNLAERRIQNPSKCLEQKQISGLILVDSAENSGLLELSSREGFYHNEHYIAFKKLLLKAINQIEALRYSHNAKIGKNREKSSTTAKSAFSSLRKQAKLKRIENFSVNISRGKRVEFKNTVRGYKTSLDKLIKIIQERQSILEARSTLGFILAEVVHEAKHPTSAVGSNLLSLSKRVKNKWRVDISKEVSKTLLDNFELDIEHIRSLESLLKRLDPLINVRRKKAYEFSIHETVKTSLLIFQERAQRTGVKITHEDLSKDKKMIGLEVDLSTAILNLIDNALYWHEQRRINNPFISITYKESNNSLDILISDNAGGISEKYTDAIFNVGFTTKEKGSGLGLSIAREALGRAGAYITHENHEEVNGSVFTIEIRKDI
ncbi:MAG: HAMP domain-containing histidine kinase, partial [Oligoflexia bacterium]|nr:HAMP domain-containing histidine kinase [Oligoflexia bacterium]